MNEPRFKVGDQVRFNDPSYHSTRVGIILKVYQQPSVDGEEYIYYRLKVSKEKSQVYGLESEQDQIYYVLEEMLF